MKLQPNQKPEDVLQMMYDNLDPLDPINWHRDELARAWNLGRSEALHDVLATLRKTIRERLKVSQRKEVEQVLELINIIEEKVK